MTDVCYPDLGRVGRLGNALYELASTLGIARARGVEPRFNADWIHRPWFSVPDRYFAEDLTDCVPAHFTDAVAHIDERHRIYLQDHNLFAGVMDELREWLAPSRLAVELLAEQDRFRRLPRPILSVHVRRGDNAPGGDPGVPQKHLWHPLPSLDYYHRAIALLRPDAASLAVFSDDIEWCHQMVPGADYYHHGLSRPKEHEADYLTAPVLDWIDWQMQVRCDLHVCSNSTYGIMAALIAGDPSAVVPWPIFGPKLDYIRADLLFPPTWTRLPGDHRATRS